MRKTITTKNAGMILQQVWHTDKPILPMGYKQQGSVNYLPFSHTSYLSQTPQTCLCKKFLSGVNFSRLGEKNAYI